MTTFDQLIKAHEQLWENTTCKQQEKKWEEENDECIEATTPDDKLYEIADCIIVSAGIGRFDYALGLEYLHKSLQFLDITKLDIHSVWDAVEKKMQKNAQRQWEKRSDVGYHHK